MIIKKLILENFKTYTQLEIDLSPEKEKPIILIGGANGGGKTTFFEAIYGALYGLKIKKENSFKELINSVTDQPISKQYIKLEIHFSRELLNETKNYRLRRIYKFHGTSVRESIEFKNDNAPPFISGTTTPTATKIYIEQEIRKVIQANLPEELSRYFLFDAMEAGSLLRREKLETVIKEHLEKVMGFDRYLQLENATTLALESYNQQQIKIAANRHLYQKWLEQKEAILLSLTTTKSELKEVVAFSIAHKVAAEQIKEGLDEDTVLKEKIDFLNTSITQISQQEKHYIQATELFIQQLDISLGLSLLSKHLAKPIQAILKGHQENKSALTTAAIGNLMEKIIAFLQEKKVLTNPINKKELLAYLLGNKEIPKKSSVFTESEIQALNKLLLLPNFPLYSELGRQKQDLENRLSSKATDEKNLDTYQSKLSKVDSSFLNKYEENENCIRELQAKIKQLETDLTELEKQFLAFEKETQPKNDKQQQQLQQLKTFFGQFSLRLLQAKKEKIEAKMKKGLNQMLLPFKGMIDRVELPIDLKNLTFSVFHINGNEIYLNQLNTASKQIVIQCLLKALHDHGNYQPPVMIDTVMGVLDKESRNSMLKNFLPQLSHQTIILSSDSEIRKETDFPLIAPFVAKTYTLKRNIREQRTVVEKGYFGVPVNCG